MMATKPDRKEQAASGKKSAEELDEQQLEELSGGALGLTGTGDDATLRPLRERVEKGVRVKRGRKRVRK